MDKASQIDNIINFSIGQPDFQIPEKIKKSLKNSIDKNQTGYSPSAGIKELREKIIKKHKTEDAIITSGVTAAIFLTYSALLQAGEELIVISPYFVVYPDLCQFLGAKAKIAETNKDFTINIENIKQKITNKTKAIIINHPNNPTGKIYSKKELLEIAEIAKENNLWIISDEVYEDFDYEKKFTSLKKFHKKTIILNGFSKNFAMTGLRLGYATGPKEIIGDMIKLQQYTFVCAPSISQWAANENFYLKETPISDFKKRRDYIYKKLKKHFGTINPEGAFYFLLQLPENINGETFSEECLKRKLLVVPGKAFGSPKNYIRISYATSMKDIKKGTDILIETLEKLNAKNNK